MQQYAVNKYLHTVASGWIFINIPQNLLTITIKRKANIDIIRRHDIYIHFLKELRLKFSRTIFKEAPPYKTCVP